MSKLSDFAAYCTSAHTAPFSSLDASSRLEVVKSFYASKGLEIPVSVTVTSMKRVSYLSKDEKNAISMAVAMAAVNGSEITEEMKNNLIALSDPSATITTTRTEPYSSALAVFGPAVVAAKMIDALSVSDNEEFHKIRKFDVPASVSIDAIPAFIKELQKIYDEANKVE